MNDANTKDYIINLRVSRATYEKIKTKASENRDTVSNLIRKVIEDSSDIMQDLSRDIFGEPKKKSFDDVVGYHEITLAREMECARCGKVMKKGAKAEVGETKSGTHYYFCGTCD